MSVFRTRWPVALACLAALPAGAANDAAGDAAREAMQRALNERTMAAAFNPGDVAKAQTWAEQARRVNVAPVTAPPAYWNPGWTCANLTAYPGYIYNDYRNCIYYHHYYGRYWR